MQLGCSTLLYGALPLDTALDGIRDAGYKAIELCAIQGMANHLPDDLDTAGYEEIGKRVADRELAIESIGVSTNLLDGQAAYRLVRILKAAAILGAPCITTGSGGKADDEESFREGGGYGQRTGQNGEADRNQNQHQAARELGRLFHEDRPAVHAGGRPRVGRPECRCLAPLADAGARDPRRDDSTASAVPLHGAGRSGRGIPIGAEDQFPAAAR